MALVIALLMGGLCVFLVLLERRGRTIERQLLMQLAMRREETMSFDTGKGLPPKTHALVLIELATKLAFAAGMSFEEFEGYALWGYQQAVKDAQLPPPVAPEPGSEKP